MRYGIIHLALVPLRATPSDKSEMISQLIFGECVQILAHKDNWIQVKNTYDNYEGWISEKQFMELSPEEYMHTIEQSETLCSSISSLVYYGNVHQPITKGAILPFYAENTFIIGHHKYRTETPVIHTQQFSPDARNIVDVAYSYLNAPYLWGGRSPFGIDCSGFTQMVFRFFAIRLYRDAYQQAEQGRTVEYLEQAQTGDLAFFENEQKRISHVGIILPDRKIIHASGCVRIDTIDHNGIFRKDLSAYSHKLRLIRRVL